jgi:hypothetical protein
MIKEKVLDQEKGREEEENIQVATALIVTNSKKSRRKVQR